MLSSIARVWEDVRSKRPLIHCITNYVTVNDVANVLLAAGASPAMVEHEHDAGGFAALAGALYINVGSLTHSQEEAIGGAVLAARQHRIPVVLDPVACGVLASYRRICNMIIDAGAVHIIKGNQAEIKNLAGFSSRASGVDSIDEGEGLEMACLSLYKRSKAVIVASGPVDLVHGRTLSLIANGTPLFQVITGSGCMLGAVIAACLAAAPEDPWRAAVCGTLAFNIAGEKAQRLAGNKPGSFKPALMDELYNLAADNIIMEARLQ